MKKIDTKNKFWHELSLIEKIKIEFAAKINPRDQK